MKRFLFSLSILLATACTPMPAPKDALARTNQEFDGQDSNMFFIDYGMPVSQKALRGGDKIYRWVSIESHSGGAGGGYINYPNGNYVVPPADTNGDMVSGYCEVSIRTDANDIIRTITLVNDSVGKFSGSRCAEIFSISDK